MLSMEAEKTDDLQREWIDELRRGNDLTAEQIRIQKDWKHSFRQGVLAGIGGVVSATLLVTLLMALLKPFERLTVLKPSLERIANQLEGKPRR